MSDQEPAEKTHEEQPEVPEVPVSQPPKETKKRASRSGTKKTTPDSSLPQKPTTSAAGAVTAGASLGTILVAIANLFDDPLRTILLYASPTVSVVLSALWVLVSRRIDEWLFNRKIEIAFRQALNAIEAALEDDKLPDEQREALEKQRQELHQMIVELRVSLLTKHLGKKN